jgi:nucleolar protein 56
LHIGDKNTLSDDSLPDLAAVLGDNEELAKDVISASKTSMGQQLSATDMDNVTLFASRVVSLANYRKTLHSYLVSKMGTVAPNLAALIGEIVGARLISHAGSLTNLSKYPASTVQILGAEKALFRALKTKGNTPKYGLLYHSSFIGRAGQKNKGRISRFLANKCSIASRIDNFSETPSTVYGQALKKQVEERLEFYASGAQPTKNETAMKNAMDKVLEQMDIDEPSKADEEMFDAEPTTVGKQEKKEKDKSEKKEKSKRKSDVDGESKKKKRKSDVDGEGDSKKKKKKSKD